MFEIKAGVNYGSVKRSKVGHPMPSHILLKIDRLKKMRLKRNKTQKFMAEKLGVSQPQYNDWEKGKYAPRSEVVAHISAILDVTVDYLYGLVDDPGETLKEDGLNEQEAAIIREIRKDDIKRYYVLKLLDLPAVPPALNAPNESDDQSKISS